MPELRKPPLGPEPRWYGTCTQCKQEFTEREQYKQALEAIHDYDCSQKVPFVKRYCCQLRSDACKALGHTEC